MICLKGIVVNWGCLSLKWRSLKITLTVPLRKNTTSLSIQFYHLKEKALIQPKIFIYCGLPLFIQQGGGDAGKGEGVNEKMDNSLIYSPIATEN